MIILKKYLSVALVFLLCIGVMVGCSSGKNLNPAEITDEIMAYVDKDIKWVSLKEGELIGYFGFSGETVVSHSAYINDAEEKYDIVSAFEFKDNKSLHTAVEKVNASLTSATQNFATAIDSEREKIANRVILSKDNVLVVVVSSNTQKIKEMLTDKGFSAVV